MHKVGRKENLVNFVIEFKNHVQLRNTVYLICCIVAVRDGGDGRRSVARNEYTKRLTQYQVHDTHSGFVYSFPYRSLAKPNDTQGTHFPLANPAVVVECKNNNNKLH